MIRGKRKLNSFNLCSRKWKKARAKENEVMTTTKFYLVRNSCSGSFNGHFSIFKGLTIGLMYGHYTPSLTVGMRQSFDLIHVTDVENYTRVVPKVMSNNFF